MMNNEKETSSLDNLVIMPYLAGSGGSTVARVFEYYVWYTEEVAPMQLRDLSEKILIKSHVQNALLRFPIRSLVLSEDEGLKLLKQNLEDLRDMEKDELIKHLRVFLLTTKRYVLRDRYLERYMGVPTFKHPLEARNLGFSIEKAIDRETQIAEKLPSITDELGIYFKIIDTSFHNEHSLRDRVYDYIAPDRPLLIDQDDIAVIKQMNTRVHLFAEAPLTDIFLIAGEAGTGKKVIAQAIHTATLEAKKEEGFHGEFHVVDCELLKAIYLEDLMSVQGGTLFFDNLERLGERDPRVRKPLQEWLKAKVDGKHPQWNKMRIIAAGNLPREDLLGKRELRDISPLFRISIDTPTLKEQGSTEIAKYIRFILNEIEQRENFKVELEEAAQAYLENYEWPGNITQLREVLERSVRNSSALREDEKQWEPRQKLPPVVVKRNQIPRELPRRILPEEPGEFLSELFVVPENYEEFKQKKKELEGMLKEKFVKRFERDFYQAELEKVGGKKPELADRLGISAQNLYRKLNELGIRE